MGWLPAHRRDLSPLIRFLKDEEWRCVPFTARMKARDREGAAGGPFRQKSRVFSRSSPEGIDGAMMITSGGLLLPVFRKPGEVLFPYLIKAVPTLHSIMGVGRDVRAVEEDLPDKASTAVDYFLMALKAAEYRPSRLPSMPGLTIRQAGPRDTGRMFPLQQGYELEEVVIHPELFHRQESYLHLRRVLHRELVLMAELHGRPVAKAGTNAQGYGASQVGGVYTLPSERNLGIGFRVMEELLRRIYRFHDCACLFVKKDNPAAQALYRRLGFRVRDEYRICYFGL